MISNQILSHTIEGLKGITKIDLCVTDAEGNPLASTFQNPDRFRSYVKKFVDTPADTQGYQGVQFFKVFDDNQLEFVLLAIGENEDAFTAGKVAVFQIQSLMVAYKERFDKDNFVKNLLLDNLLLVDIYNRAKKLHIDTELRRAVWLIEIRHEYDREQGQGNLDLLHSVYTGRPRDFITAIDEKSLIVVRAVEEDEGYPELIRAAQALQQTLSSAANCQVRIAIGTIVHEIKDVSRSYKEARMALDVGKIFYMDQTVAAYSNLGIGRLIYQLPIPLCKMFIKEIFENKSPEDFDEETLTTINKFFENSLNVSETSRQLYIHRNTLVYRLDKLNKITGLDLRVFDDAITFKIALMVVKYMKYMESLE